ncbi:MAG: (d)CMP kinase [Solirubrobacteraceae bacterium]|nr:(d)CMP kinase [Solirubrobacteraceae bacterium]
MTDQAHARAVRRQAMVRLGLFFVVIFAVAIAVIVGGIIDVKPKALQEEIRSTGPLAPLVYVVFSGILGALFVPGPVMAIAGGLLFGPWVGIPLGLLSAALTAVVCREISARLGRNAAEDLAGATLGQLTAWLDRYGLVAVIAFRLLPAMPDAPLNYAAGLTRLKAWQIGVGTLIGSIPRTLGWGLVGASAGGGSNWLAVAGGALIVAADAGGALIAILAARYLGISPRALIRRMRGQPAEHAASPWRGQPDPGASPTIAPMRIAIDGPAGAGKSTVARLVAANLGFTYLDTGAMYRCAALASLRGLPPGDVDVDFDAEGAVYLGGEDVSLLIRTPEVSSLASQVAAEPDVRAGLVARQRELMSQGDWVAEGRDIGTVVAPDAELKIFLDADPLERAQRRADQLGADVQEILAQQQERDERDRTRQTSPLMAADDAVRLDTTGMSIDQVVAKIAELAKSRGAAA